MHGTNRFRITGLAVLAILTAIVPTSVQADANLDVAMQYRPAQSRVDIDDPSAEELANCTVTSGSVGGHGAWIVKSPDGVTIRQLVDTTGDGRLDQWRYFRAGLEVYRDIDTDGNNQADQFRWFHTAGSRWGIDEDGDMTIDAWKTISAEEATAELIEALGQRDPKRFARLLLSEAELAALKLGAETTERLQTRLKDAETRFATLAAGQTQITAETEWVQFSAGLPGFVPSDTLDSTEDLLVYENVMAVAQTGDQHTQVQVGTVIKVGSTWRLIDVPTLGLDSDGQIASAGFFFRTPSAAPVGAGMEAPSDELQKLLAELQDIDTAASTTTDEAELVKLNDRRADVSMKLVQQADSPEDRENYVRQMADIVGMSIQSGTYPGGVVRLTALHSMLAENEADRDSAAYVKFTVSQAEYWMNVQANPANFVALQTAFMTSLQELVDTYPTSPIAAEALVNLAMYAEFAGQDEDAKQYYAKIVKDFAEEPVAGQAAGSIRRLDSVGQVMTLRGTSADGHIVDLASYRGKVVVIQYWASLHLNSKSDMLILNGLISQYDPSEIQVIGVNLDSDEAAMRQFLADNAFPWPQLHEEGGTASRLATEMGVMNPPLMLVIDKAGRVVNRNAMVNDLDGELKRLLD